jgi:hypothetical protein
LIINYIVGLGGRDVTLNDVVSLTRKALKNMRNGSIEKPVQWVGVRGLE